MYFFKTAVFINGGELRSTESNSTSPRFKPQSPVPEAKLGEIARPPGRFMLTAFLNVKSIKLQIRLVGRGAVEKNCLRRFACTKLYFVLAKIDNSHFALTHVLKKVDKLHFF